MKAALLSETYAMLAIALGSLAIASAIVTFTARGCAPGHPVLLEALPRLSARPGAVAIPLALDRITTSDAGGSRPADARDVRMRNNDAVEIRGRARDAVTGERAAAVFAVLDDRAAYRATYDERTGGDRFSVVIPTDGLSPGSHTVHVRIVAADLSGYYEPRAPIQLAIR